MNGKKTNLMLGIIALGIWTIAIQNTGLFEKNETKRVYVVNKLDTNVSGSVEIENTVDINIQEINGKSNVFYQDNDGSFMLLPVRSR